MTQIPAHEHSIEPWRHDHRFEIHDSGAERRVSIVLWLTFVTMGIEIAAGLIFNSMALLADGIHMGTHAGALAIATFAYRYARAHRSNPQFSFGTGKVSSLAGFASAILLGVVAILTAYEAGSRLIAPGAIDYDAALLVAVVGLAINVVSARLLGGGHAHHGHDHGETAHDGHDAHDTHDDHEGNDHARPAAGKDAHKHDHNLRAAYVHVLADAATSVLAIGALVGGRWQGLVWLDPAVALLGCALIAWWAIGLIGDTSAVLLDRAGSLHMHEDIQRAIEEDGDSEVADMHIWRVGARAHVAMVTVVTHQPSTPAYYKHLIRRVAGIDHVTVEVNRCLPDGSPHSAGVDLG